PRRRRGVNPPDVSARRQCRNTATVLWHGPAPQRSGSGAMGNFVETRNLTKTFAGGRRAVDRVDVTVGAGELVALIGASGSGQSPRLRLRAGLVPCDRSAGGEILVDSRTVQKNGRLSSRIREQRAGIGFVFQQFNLVDRLPVLTNVLTGALGRIPLHR